MPPTHERLYVLVESGVRGGVVVHGVRGSGDEHEHVALDLDVGGCASVREVSACGFAGVVSHVSEEQPSPDDRDAAGDPLARVGRSAVEQCSGRGRFAAVDCDFFASSIAAVDSTWVSPERCTLTIAVSMAADASGSRPRPCRSTPRLSGRR